MSSTIKLLLNMLYNLYRMFVCQICNLFGGNTFSAVLRHMGEIHRFDHGLIIRCGIGRCPQTYTNYESFRSHVYRKHREVLHSQSVSILPQSVADCNEGFDEGDEEMTCDAEVAVPDVKMIGAKFLLKTREEHRIPQSTLNNIIFDMKGLWMSSIEIVRDEVKKFMSNAIEDGDLMKSITDSFPLIGLETEYLQLQYYNEHFNYLVRKCRKNNL